MKNNIKIAKQLVKIAKQLILGFNIDIYNKNLDSYKGPLIDLLEDSFDEIQDIDYYYFDYFVKIFYMVLINSSKTVKDESWVTKQIIRKYYNELVKISTIRSRSWSQFQPDGFDNKKYGDNYNYYVTILLSSEQDVDNYIDFLKQTADMFNKIAKEKKMFFVFKTHTSLEYLFEHNDTFKVYFFNKRQKSYISNLINELLKKHGLKTGERIYNSGKDTYDDNEIISGSYGKRLSKYISVKITNKLKQMHKKKEEFNAEKMFNYVKDNFGDMLNEAIKTLK